MKNDRILLTGPPLLDMIRRYNLYFIYLMLGEPRAERRIDNTLTLTT